MREREPDGVGAHEAGRSGPEKREAGQDGMRGSGPVSNGAEILASDRDVAAGKAATDSTGTASANVNDGKLSSTTSFGTCGSEDCYAQIDLGGVYDIDKVNVYCGGVNTLYKYEIQVSLNGATFTTVGAKTDDQMEFPNGYTVGFEKVSARYVRVVGKYYNKGNGISFPVSGAYRYLQICWDDSERGDGYVGLAEMEVYDAEGNLLS